MLIFSLDLARGNSETSWKLDKFRIFCVIGHRFLYKGWGWVLGHYLLIYIFFHFNRNLTVPQPNFRPLSRGQLHTASVPPFCWVEQLSVPKLVKGEGYQIKNECLGGRLIEFLLQMFVLGRGEPTMFPVSKKTLHWGLNFKCWSCPVLTK